MRWLPFQIKCFLSALTGGLTFYCVCSQYVILQHNAKQESGDWMCPTDHGYEICWREETCAAAAYLSCRCHTISNLTGACSRTSQNRCKAVKTLLLLIPVCTSSILHPAPVNPIPHQSTTRLHSHHHPPSSKLDSPLTSHPLHPYIHTCITALISMHGHKCGPKRTRA